MRKITLLAFCMFMIMNVKAFSNVFHLEGDDITFKSSSADSGISVAKIPPGFITHSSTRSQTATNYTAACTAPQFSLIKDCNPDQQYFTVEVTVDNLGSATTVVIKDNQGTTPQELSNLGSVTFGPYPYNVDIEITVQNADDDTCKTTQIVNSDSCPPIVCNEATPFCSDEGLFFENNWDGDEAGREEAPVGIDYGCLYTTPNPAWFFLKIGESGDLTLHITQNTEYDENGNPTGVGLDVDFIAWGPFDSLEEACSNLTIANQVDDNAMGDGCSYSYLPEEDFGIVNAEEGQIYVLLITNYDGDQGYIQVTQSAGEGSTNCSIVNDNEILACEGEEITLTTETTDQYAYVWSKYNPQTDQYEPIALPDGQTEYDDTITVTESGKYKLESYNNLGEITTEIFTVIISPKPEMANLEDHVSLCGVQNVALDATVTNPLNFGTITYQWFDEAGSVVSGEAIFEATQPGTYTVEATGTLFDSGGYESEASCTTTIIVEVTNASFSVNLGNNQNLCGQDTYEITAQISDGNTSNATYHWFGPNGPISQNTETISVTENGVYTANVTINGCSSSASVDIQFNTPPEFTLGEDITTCNLEGVVINATPSNTSPGQTTFEWSYNNAPIQESGPTVEAANYGFGTYSVTVYETDPECATTQEITINQIDNFEVQLSSENQLSKTLRYCTNASEKPNYTVSLSATLVNTTTEGVIFTWYKNGNVIDGATTSSYSAVYDSEGEYTDEYTVEASIGSCVASATITTEVKIIPYEHPCKITEGLSPGNHDGLNDILDLTYLNDRSGIAKFEVFNRYGTKVYKKENYTNTWHGQDDNGNELVTGTYYYIITFKNEDPVYGNAKRGWIYINQKSN